MKLNKNILCFALASMALTSCNMDYNEYTAYDKEYIQRSFTYVGGLMTKIYNDIDTDWGNLSGAMLSSATDESEYSHDGNSVEDLMVTGVHLMHTRPSGLLLTKESLIVMR